MDEQHGVLMDTVRELRQALARGAGRERVREELNRLQEFTRMHFASEEQLLELHNYPELEEHHKAHRRMLLMFQEIVQRIEHNEDLDMHSLQDFLRHWYVEHIEELDHHYGKWLNARGIY